MDPSGSKMLTRPHQHTGAVSSQSSRLLPSLLPPAGPTLNTTTHHLTDASFDSFAFRSVQAKIRFPASLFIYNLHPLKIKI